MLYFVRVFAAHIERLACSSKKNESKCNKVIRFRVLATLRLDLFILLALNGEANEMGGESLKS